jgi:UDP-2,3-diacylglucosamine pyrophosphatase LpxH
MAAKGGVRRSSRLRVRTLFLSDTHLGFKPARVRELNEFLQGVEADCIVLVGDIIDALSLCQRVFWTAEHTQVVRTLLARGRAGTRLIYIPGNHDASLALLADMLQGQFEVHREWVHRTARGERLLVLHGDQFDAVVTCPGWLTHLGDALYYVSVGLSHTVNNLRRLIGEPYWPLVERLKLSIGTSLRYITQFEQLAAQHARAQGYDGFAGYRPTPSGSPCGLTAGCAQRARAPIPPALRATLAVSHSSVIIARMAARRLTE